jgi:uncharacterized protein
MKNCFRIFCVSMIALTALCTAYAGQSGNETRAKKQLAPEANQKMDAKHKVVFHLDWNKEPRLIMAVKNIENLFKTIPPAQCMVSVVANGKAVVLFRKDRATKYAADIDALHKKGVHFKICANAMANNKIKKADLLDACDVVPAGILEIMNLEHEGYAYIKP